MASVLLGNRPRGAYADALIVTCRTWLLPLPHAGLLQLVHLPSPQARIPALLHWFVRLPLPQAGLLQLVLQLDPLPRNYLQRRGTVGKCIFLLLFNNPD